MPTRASKRPTDANQLAKMIVDMSTGDLPKEEPPPEREKNPAAVALGKLGASKGGQARGGCQIDCVNGNNQLNLI